MRDVTRGVAAKEDYVVAKVAAAAAVAPAAAAMPSTYTMMYNGKQGNLGMRWKSFPRAGRLPHLDTDRPVLTPAGPGFVAAGDRRDDDLARAGRR